MLGQGFGNLAAGIVGMIASAAFLNSSPDNVDYVWRIVLMFGAIPALLTYYWRMKMPETARYTALVAKNAKMAAADMSTVLNMHIVPEEEAVDELPAREEDQYGLFSTEFLHRHGLHLLGTTVCWFVLDVSFYSLNIFMKDIFTIVDLVPDIAEADNNPLRRMINITGLHTLIALAGSLPGYFFAVVLVDRIGRVKIQLLGFAMMAALTLGLAIPYDSWREHKNKKGFAIMYALIFFFANFGPNTTTFILPAELFPARLRSTCHGISGAVGKIGAILGVFAFSFMEKAKFKTLLFVLVGCNLVGLVFTLLLPETNGKSLEEITGEMEESQPPDDEAAVAAPHHDIRTVPI